MPNFVPAAEIAKPPKNSAMTGLETDESTRVAENVSGSRGRNKATIPTHSSSVVAYSGTSSNSQSTRHVPATHAARALFGSSMRAHTSDSTVTAATTGATRRSEVRPRGGDGSA